MVGRTQSKTYGNTHPHDLDCTEYSGHGVLWGRGDKDQDVVPGEEGGEVALIPTFLLSNEQTFLLSLNVQLESFISLSLVLRSQGHE